MILVSDCAAGTSFLTCPRRGPPVKGDGVSNRAAGTPILTPHTHGLYGIGLEKEAGSPYHSTCCG